MLRDVFPGKGKYELGYVLKPSGHACVQHYYSCAPPPHWFQASDVHYPPKPALLIYMLENKLVFGQFIGMILLDI